MDAELELEMAQGLGPSPRPPAGSPGAPGRAPGGPGGGGDSEGRLCRHCYSPAQVGRGRVPRAGPGGCQRSWPGGPGQRLQSFGPCPCCSALGDPVTEASAPGSTRPQVQRTGRAAVPHPPRSPHPVIIPPVPAHPVRLGESVAGQRLFNHQGLLGGGADHHRQPVWLHIPPLLLAGRLQEVPSRQAGGKAGAWPWAGPREKPHSGQRAARGLALAGQPPGTLGLWAGGPTLEFPARATPLPLAQPRPVLWWP